MNIYLIRHGDAESMSLRIPDFERKLTLDGIDTITKAAEGWKKLIPEFDFIVSSNLVRAVQTSEIVKEVFGYKGEIIFDRCITSGDPKSVLELAVSLKGRNIAFVGHEPHFSRYTAEMISATEAYINFKKGMIAKIVFEGKKKVGAGELEFLIPAKAYK